MILKQQHQISNAEHYKGMGGWVAGREECAGCVHEQSTSFVTLALPCTGCDTAKGSPGHKSQARKKKTKSLTFGTSGLTWVVEIFHAFAEEAYDWTEADLPEIRIFSLLNSSIHFFTLQLHKSSRVAGWPMLSFKSNTFFLRHTKVQ